MAVSFISVDVDDSRLQEFFAFAGYKARDLRDPLRESMDDVVIPAIREQIFSQGERSGQPYDPLNEEYELEKIDAVGFAVPILVRSGQMLADLTADSSYRVFKDHAVYNPESDYAHWHQTGGTTKGRPPRRVILNLIPEDEEHIQRIFEAWLAELRDANRARRGSGQMPSFNILDHFNIL